MRFATLDSYLAHFAANQGPAVLPIDVVATHRSVTRPTVLRMLSDGRLSPVYIDGEVFVTPDSYSSLMRKDAERAREVEQIIKDHAQLGKIITYNKIMAPIGLSTQSPPDRKIIGRILGKISADSYAAHGIFLTAIVHRKYSSGTKPGAGFFDLVEQITGRRLAGDEMTATNSEVKKVFAFYKSIRSKRL